MASRPQNCGGVLSNSPAGSTRAVNDQSECCIRVQYHAEGYTTPRADKLVYDAFALCLAKQEETGVEPEVINMFDESREEILKKIVLVLRNFQKKVAVDESIVNWHWAACDKTAAHRRRPRPDTSRL